jgi:nucleotide-binding universal stress UspA family protein
MSGRVVVGVKNTLGGFQALRYAVDQARQREAELLAVRNFQSSSAALMVSIDNELATAAAEHVIEVFTIALGGPPKDIVVRAQVIAGSVGPNLVRIANRPDDLLVVGGSGAGFRMPLRGRVAAYLARHAVCPVVVVPPPPVTRAGVDRRSARHLAREVEQFLAGATASSNDHHGQQHAA